MRRVTSLILHKFLKSKMRIYFVCLELWLVANSVKFHSLARRTPIVLEQNTVLEV